MPVDIAGTTAPERTNASQPDFHRTGSTPSPIKAAQGPALGDTLVRLAESAVRTSGRATWWLVSQAAGHIAHAAGFHRPAHTSADALPQATNKPLYDEQVVTLADGTRLAMARNELQGTHEMLAPVVSPSNREVRTVGIDAMVATASLQGAKQADQRPNVLRQDEPLGVHFAQSSGVALPPKYHDGSFVGCPVDWLPERKEDGSLVLRFLELNGLGWGGPFTMPNNFVGMLKSTIQKVAGWTARQFGNDALLVINNSGRADPADPKESQMFHEKVVYSSWAQEAMAEVLGEEEVRIVAFEPEGFEERVVNKPGWLHEPKATVMPGYMRQIGDSPGGSVRGGLPFFFERRAQSWINDRAMSVFQKDKGEVDTRHTIVMNPTIEIGSDKGVAYRAYNDFVALHGERFPLCGGRINFVDGLTEKEHILQAVKERFLDRGLPAALKPSGVGHGDGIEYCFPGDSDSSIRDAIEKSLATVDARYGLDKAGFPYTVMDRYEAMKIVAAPGTPLHYADGCKAELRVGVVADFTGPVPMLRAVPYVIKVDLSKSGTANASNAMERGAEITDLQRPGCSADELALFGFTVGQMTELCQASTRYVQHVLMNDGRYGVK